MLKGIVLPKLLFRALRIADVSREVEPIIGFTSSAMLGILMFIVSFWVSSKYANIEMLINFLTLPTALYAILVGLLSKGLKVNNLGDIPQGKGTIIFIPDA